MQVESVKVIEYPQSTGFTEIAFKFLGLNESYCVGIRTGAPAESVAHGLALAAADILAKAAEVGAQNKGDDNGNR